MKKILVTSMLLCCLTACIADGGSDVTAPEFLAVGTPAPAFTIYTDAYPDGYPLSALQGRYVVLEFWASWCPDCRAVTDDMLALYRTYGSGDIVFVGVSFDTNEDTWRAYVSEHDLSWQQHFETSPWKESAVAAAYNVQWIPTFYVVDRDGTILLGTIDIGELEETLSTLTPTTE